MPSHIALSDLVWAAAVIAVELLWIAGALAMVAWGFGWITCPSVCGKPPHRHCRCQRRLMHWGDHQAPCGATWTHMEVLDDR